MRQINGQLEQMQFETRRLEEQLKKFQEDVDFRFHDGGARRAPPPNHPQKRSEAPEVPEAVADDPLGAPGAVRAIAAEPGAAMPSIHPKIPPRPGAPRPLGSRAAASASRPTASACGATRHAASATDQNDPGAPLDLSNGRSRTAGGAAAEAAAQPGAPSTAVVTTPGGTVIARSAQIRARMEFDIALAFLKQKAYEDAEKGFTGFLEKNPKNKLASDAIYYLGESYYLRGRQREAAEQYLKISTHYPEFAARTGGSFAPRPVAERSRRQGASLRDLRRNRPEISKCSGHGQGRRRAGGQTRAMLRPAADGY